MNARLIICLIFMASSSAFAIGLSPLRLSHESYDEARARSGWELALNRNLNLFEAQAYRQRARYNSRMSAEGQRRPLTELEVFKVNEVSEEQLNRAFDYLRDSRFLKSKTYARRLTWLYPDDGCYARAGVMGLKHADVLSISPSKIFVFGNLAVQTPNTASGWVGWWYHVAIVYRVGGHLWIIDPSIQPEGPLRLEAWAQRMSDFPTELKYSICSVKTYDPDSNCFEQSGVPEGEIYRDQNSFLPMEWERLIELGRNPQKELGDFPPWRKFEN